MLVFVVLQHIDSSSREDFIAVLDGIHEAGVIHRDIRPPNLLVNQDGRVFVIDFDKAKLCDNESKFASECRDLRCLLDGHYLPECGPETDDDYLQIILQHRKASGFFRMFDDCYP